MPGVSAPHIKFNARFFLNGVCCVFGRRGGVEGLRLEALPGRLQLEVGLHGFHILTDLLQLALRVTGLLEGDSGGHCAGLLREHLLVELRNSRSSGHQLVGQLALSRLCQAEEALARLKHSGTVEAVTVSGASAVRRALVGRGVIVSLHISDGRRILAGERCTIRLSYFLCGGV